MSAKQSKATNQVREHVDRAHDAIIDFRRDGISADGVLMKPVCEELSKAIAIIERTKWERSA